MFMMKSAKLSITTWFACTLPITLAGCLGKKDISQENYYIMQKSKLLEDFDNYFGSGRSVLVASMDETLADQILKEARIEYEAIIPKIPYRDLS